MKRVTTVPLPVTIAVAVAILSACSTAKECALPWTTMDHLRSYGSSNYQTNDASEEFADIFVPSRADPVIIAGALADALLKKREARVGEQAVVAWPPIETLPVIEATPGGLGGPLIRFDSGYVAEFQEGLLHFDICTSWIDHPAGGTVCDERLEFDVEKVGASP